MFETASDADEDAQPKTCCVPVRSRWVLLAIIAVFLLLRGPVMYRQIPAQDEDYFAVPGYTILKEGVPRIPYMPTANPESAFYRADRMLFALPPLYFYWQAAVYAVLGPSTGNARLASTLAGMAVVVVVYLLSRQWFRNESAALWAAGLYAFSRVAYFPCMIARPDMVCALFGLLALLFTGRWHESRRQRWLLAAGVSIGLGFLSHPFALIFALQVGVWVLIAGRSIGERFANAVLVTMLAVAGFALWLPLIAMEPEIFKLQFGNNVFHRSGPGLLSRLVMPTESFGAQTLLLYEHAGPIQLSLMLLALVTITWHAWRTRRGWSVTAAWLAWSGIYLHVACQGTHPAKGYWCYTAAPMFIMLGYVITQAIDWLRGFALPGKLAGLAIVGGIVLAMVPGSGLRTLAAHLRHWNDVNYNAPLFTQELMDRFPNEGTFVVDPGYIFDFHRSGRETLLALRFPFFFDVSQAQFDFLIGGPYSLRDGVPLPLQAQFQYAVGDRADLFSCYAEVYTAPAHRRTTSATESSPP